MGATRSGKKHNTATGRRRRQLGVAVATQHATPQSSFADLPTSALSQILDQLSMRDLAAAACTCRAWREEAADQRRWEAMWQTDVVGDGRPSMSWRWAQAFGGPREQLRAKALVRHGTPAATVFPVSRADGPIQEVLFFDGGPGHCLIITVHAFKPPAHCVLLHGSTVKLWDADALNAGIPRRQFHDVLKHLQLESGQLFMWRIADDAAIRTQPSPSSPAPGEVEEAAHWTEHEAIVASLFDPVTMELRDVPLQTTYGRGTTASEFIDLSGGLLACTYADLAAQRVVLRLLDLESGACFRETACPRPPLEDAALPADHISFMMLTRNCEPGNHVIAAAALFDCRLMLMPLRDEWLMPEGRTPEALARQTRHAAAAQAAAATAAAATEGIFAAQQRRAQRLQSELHVGFVTPDMEPVVDVSMGTAARRIYVVGMRHLFLVGTDGVPHMAVDMSDWRGVNSERLLTRFDVGAFSWPLPNSSAAIFWLDITNSLFASSFKLLNTDAEVNAEVQALEAADQAEGRASPFDVHWARDLFGRPQGRYVVQSHTDLRPLPPLHGLHTAGGRHLGSTTDQVVVEYTQAGASVFTVGDAVACESVSRLLRQEQARGTYLRGCGPKSRLRAGRKLEPERAKPNSKRAVAPRAIVCIDTATGCRYRAIPIEGSIESLHSAGHFLVAAVSNVGGEGTAGALVVLDFSGKGMALKGRSQAVQQLPAAGRRRQRAAA